MSCIPPIIVRNMSGIFVTFTSINVQKYKIKAFVHEASIIFKYVLFTSLNTYTKAKLESDINGIRYKRNTVDVPKRRLFKKEDIDGSINNGSICLKVNFDTE
jgi:hypothetical protein